MKKRKIIMYIAIIFIVLLIFGIGYLVYINVNNEEETKEYTPEQEISDEQMRETVVNLYFLNEETNELEMERRAIDSKLLLENPYKTLIMLLMEGPQSENLKKIMPEYITINNVEFKNGVVFLNLSNNFENEEKKELIIQSIEKTLKQLNEVEQIEIINN